MKYSFLLGNKNKVIFVSFYKKHTIIIFFFNFSACTKGIIPKQNDYVSCEATHTPGATYKWKAIKVQVSNPGRDYLNLKSITNSRIENGKLKI